MLQLKSLKSAIWNLNKRQLSKVITTTERIQYWWRRQDLERAFYTKLLHCYPWWVAIWCCIHHYYYIKDRNHIHIRRTTKSCHCCYSIWSHRKYLLVVLLYTSSLLPNFGRKKLELGLFDCIATYSYWLHIQTTVSTRMLSHKIMIER